MPDLHAPAMPKLRVTRGDGQADLAWQVPGDRPFPLPVTVSIDGERNTTALQPGDSKAIPSRRCIRSGDG